MLDRSGERLPSPQHVSAGSQGPGPSFALTPAPHIAKPYPELFQNVYAIEHFRRQVLDDPTKLRSALRKTTSSQSNQNSLSPSPSSPASSTSTSIPGSPIPSSELKNKEPCPSVGWNVTSENDKSSGEVKIDVGNLTSGVVPGGGAAENGLQQNDQLLSPGWTKRPSVRRHETFSDFETRSTDEDDDKRIRRPAPRVTFWAELEVKNMATGGIRVQNLLPPTNPTGTGDPVPNNRNRRREVSSLRRHKSDVSHEKRRALFIEKNSADGESREDILKRKKGRPEKPDRAVKDILRPNSFSHPASHHHLPPAANSVESEAASVSRRAKKPSKDDYFSDSERRNVRHHNHAKMDPASHDDRKRRHSGSDLSHHRRLRQYYTVPSASALAGSPSGKSERQQPQRLHVTFKKPTSNDRLLYEKFENRQVSLSSDDERGRRKAKKKSDQRLTSPSSSSMSTSSASTNKTAAVDIEGMKVMNGCAGSDGDSGNELREERKKRRRKRKEAKKPKQEEDNSEADRKTRFRRRIVLIVVSAFVFFLVFAVGSVVAALYFAPGIDNLVRKENEARMKMILDAAAGNSSSSSSSSAASAAASSSLNSPVTTSPPAFLSSTDDGG